LSLQKRSSGFLNHLKFDGCLIEDPTDLLYLTGLQLSAGIIGVTSKKIKLFVDGRYFEYCSKHSPFPVELISKEAVEKFLVKAKEIAFDSVLTSVDRFEQLKKQYSTRLRPVPQILKKARAVKDEAELKAMEKSAKLCWKGFEHVKKILKVGITEREVALAFEIFCRENGAEKLAFDPIIAFGKNSAYPHYHPGNVKLKKGDLVLVDIGVSLDHYHSDMTRTVFFGKPDPRLVLLETVVKKAHGAAIAICKAGVKVGDLDKAARKVIAAAGMEEMIVHSLGHGIGLETHEFPRLKYKGDDHDVILEADMVITIEPGLYLPGVGGIRYEDTVAVTKNGCKNFYKSTHV